MYVHTLGPYHPTHDELNNLQMSGRADSGGPFMNEDDGSLREGQILTVVEVGIHCNIT